MPRPMSAQTRNEKEMSQEAAIQSRKAKTTLEKLRWACLSRGATGILGLSRSFRIADDDRSGFLNTEEFKKALHDFGLGNLSPQEYNEIFQEFDCDGSGTVEYDSFLRALRPPMSVARKEIIMKAFDKLDKSGDGTVTVEDISSVYNVRGHPQYQNGEKTEKQLLKEYLVKFEQNGVVDGKVSQGEFMEYYAGVSASIDSDVYFDLMMRQAWKLK